MKSILVCSQEHDYHTSDSELRMADCGHRVWISQSGLKAIEKHDLEIRCMACLPIEGELNSLPEIQKEVEQLLGKEVAAAALASLQEPGKLARMILTARLPCQRDRNWQ